MRQHTEHGKTWDVWKRGPKNDLAWVKLFCIAEASEREEWQGAFAPDGYQTAISRARNQKPRKQKQKAERRQTVMEPQMQASGA